MHCEYHPDQLNTVAKQHQQEPTQSYSRDKHLSEQAINLLAPAYLNPKYLKPIKLSTFDTPQSPAAYMEILYNTHASRMAYIVPKPYFPDRAEQRFAHAADQGNTTMLDLIYLITGAACLYACVLYAFACDNL